MNPFIEFRLAVTDHFSNKIAAFATGLSITPPVNVYEMANEISLITGRDFNKSLRQIKMYEKLSCRHPSSVEDIHKMWKERTFRRAFGNNE